MNGYHPHKTAIARKVGVMTSPARWLLNEVLNPQGIRPQSVLDFGSGKSHDDDVWAQRTGAFSMGWDPYPHRGFEHRTQRPPYVFELVTVNFVLNILDSDQERMNTLIDAANFVAPGGLLWISTRSVNIVNKDGLKKGWGQTINGSWISSPAKGTVQFGMDDVHILDLARRAGLHNLVSQPLPGKPYTGCECVLFRKQPIV